MNITRRLIRFKQLKKTTTFSQIEICGCNVKMLCSEGHQLSSDDGRIEIDDVQVVTCTRVYSSGRTENQYLEYHDNEDYYSYWLPNLKNDRASIVRCGQDANCYFKQWYIGD